MYGLNFSPKILSECFTRRQVDSTMSLRFMNFDSIFLMMGYSSLKVSSRGFSDLSLKFLSPFKKSPISSKYPKIEFNKYSFISSYIRGLPFSSKVFSKVASFLRRGAIKKLIIAFIYSLHC